MFSRKSVSMIALALACSIVYGCEAKKAETEAPSGQAMHAHAAEETKTEQASVATAAEGASTQAAQLVPQKTCPVMGEKIDKKYFADHDGKRVYFCCAHCVHEFKQDPAKYLKKLEELGEMPEQL